MATITFLGRDDDWENPDNWDTHAPPIKDDKVIFPHFAKSSLMRHIDRGFLDLWSMWIHPGYKGDIGCEGNPLKLYLGGAIGYTGAGLLHNGAGELHLNTTWGSYPIVVNTPGNKRALTLSGDGIVSHLICMAGHTTIAADRTGAITDVWILESPRGGRGAQRQPDVSLIDRSASAIAELMMRRGTVEYFGDIPTIKVHGGHITAHRASSTALVDQHDGEFIYNASPDLLGVLSLWGGTFDTTQTSDAKTITTLYEAPASNLLRSEHLTVTNEHTLFDSATRR